MFINNPLRIIIVCLCILGLGNSSSVLANVDSLLVVCKGNQLSNQEQFKAINAYYAAHTSTKSEDFLPLINYHYTLAKNNDEEREVLRALNQKAFVLYFQGNNTASMETLEQALDFAISIDDSIAIARQYGNIGNVCRMQNKYQLTIRYYELSLNIFEKKKKLDFTAQTLSNIGLIHYGIRDYDRALSYFNQALELYKTLGIENKIGVTWRNIGLIHYDKGNNEQALIYAKKSIQILQKDQNSFFLLDGYLLYATAQEQLGQVDSALYYAEKGIAITKKIANQKKTFSIEILIARILIAKDIDKATLKAENILAKLNSQTDKSVKVALFEVLYQCYKVQKKYERSLSMHEQYLLYKDSLQIENDRMAIIRHAVQNEYEDKLHQNQIAHEKAQAALELKQLKRTFTVVSLFILLVLGITIYARSSIINSRKEQEGLLEEIERLKNLSESPVVLQSNKFELNREKIEQFINRKINETDWKVLNILLDDPVISNKEIAEKAFMSVDGIGSSLRRMYGYIDVKESKYKKISLLMEAIKISNDTA